MLLNVYILSNSIKIANLPETLDWNIEYPELNKFL
nr:MAG TPA: hypothetical protein [Caudoviricetes sp.]